MNESTIYLGLGSNLGDRRALIESALNALDAHQRVSVEAVSSIIETEPVGPGEQGAYLNAAARLKTTLCPRDMLDLCLEIERNHGRDRSREIRWGPRQLDLDILLYEAMVMNEPGLTIPHPRMHERGFVLGPLQEIAAAVVHPVLGESIECLWRQLGVQQPLRFDDLPNCVLNPTWNR